MEASRNKNTKDQIIQCVENSINLINNHQNIFTVVTKEIMNSGKIFKEFYDGIMDMDSKNQNTPFISNFAKNKISSLKKIIHFQVFFNERQAKIH